MTGKTRYDYKLGSRCISPPVRTVCERTLAVSKYSLYFHPWCTCGNNSCPHQQCPLGSQARIAFWPCPLHRWLMRKTKLSWIGVAKFYDLNFSNYNYRSLLFPPDIYFSNSASSYDEGKKHCQHRSMYFSTGPGAPCPACLRCFPSQRKPDLTECHASAEPNDKPIISIMCLAAGKLLKHAR